MKERWKRDEREREQREREQREREPRAERELKESWEKERTEKELKEREQRKGESWESAERQLRKRAERERAKGHVIFAFLCQPLGTNVFELFQTGWDRTWEGRGLRLGDWVLGLTIEFGGFGNLLMLGLVFRWGLGLLVHIFFFDNST